MSVQEDTVFLVECNAKVYVLCEKEDGTEYGGVGDQVPIFIHPENPFVFYTEQYKKKLFKKSFGANWNVVFGCDFHLLVLQFNKIDKRRSH